VIKINSGKPAPFIHSKNEEEEDTWRRKNLSLTLRLMKIKKYFKGNHNANVKTLNTHMCTPFESLCMAPVVYRKEKGHVPHPSMDGFCDKEVDFPELRFCTS
jgi:hypothetical protein